MSRESEKTPSVVAVFFPIHGFFGKPLRIVPPSRQGNYRIKNRASLSFLRFSAVSPRCFESSRRSERTDGMHAEPRCREDDELLLFPFFPASPESFFRLFSPPPEPGSFYSIRRSADNDSAKSDTDCPLRYSALRTVIRTFSATDTAVRYFISFRSDFLRSRRHTATGKSDVPRDENSRSPYPSPKNDTDLPRVARIYVSQIRLFRKDKLPCISSVPDPAPKPPLRSRGSSPYIEYTP